MSRKNMKNTGKVNTPFSIGSFLPREELENFILPGKMGRIKSFPLNVSFFSGWGEADMPGKENSVNASRKSALRKIPSFISELSGYR